MFLYELSDCGFGSHCSHLKAFRLIHTVNETRFLVQFEWCECICGLNKSICKSKKNWNPDECWCKCKELDVCVISKRVIK